MPTSVEIPFVKMHGAGNDVIILWQQNVLDGQDMSVLSEQMCRRYFGVGADQLLLLSKNDDNTIHMQTYNADGSQGGNCGNGLRCVARYLFDSSFVKEKEFPISTPSRVCAAKIDDRNNVHINMARPLFDFASLPATPGGDAKPGELVELNIEDKTFSAMLVSMGNPHCVVVADGKLRGQISDLGKKIEHHPMFPERTNVMFAQVVSPNNVNVSHWERGSGLTLACGTGACATAAALIRQGLVESCVTIQMTGGELKIDWQPGRDLWLSGPVAMVYQGKYLENKEPK